MISLRREPPVAWLEFDRPDKRNALPLQGWQAIPERLAEVDHGATEVILLRGLGGYFCAGADLAALDHARQSRERADIFCRAVVGALLAIHHCPTPVITLVEGGAAGGGIELMLACRGRITIGVVPLIFPFGGHGIQLDSFTAWRFQHLIGATAAAELTQGRQVRASDDPQLAGLIERTVPLRNNDPDSTIDALALEAAIDAAIELAKLPRADWPHGPQDQLSEVIAPMMASLLRD